MEKHEKYMHRCLELAAKALGHTYPNPLVGSVIVYKDKIIGEGYHAKAGENHAEINAIESVKDKSLLRKSTLYVNLEPCSHYGKTPPCAKKIADLKIPRVVIGTIDTTDKVSGKGIKILRDAGIQVSVGILNNKSRELNKRFFTFHEKKRPYIILKWAQTLDGFIAPLREEQTTSAPIWITDENERTLVHKWRAEEQAILVGKNTAFIDNPELTVRTWFGKNPIRIILDRNLSLHRNLNIFDGTVKTIIFNHIKEEKINDSLSFVKINNNSNELKQIFLYLYNQNIQSVIIEGGAKIIQNFYDNNLWDEARIFVGNKFFNSGKNLTNIFFPDNLCQKKFLNSNLFILRNEQNTAF